ncbi:MAG: tetratricopeptide repeat-containing sulfotransferase family protein [Planctomycetota bacterium]|jgi:tetratricopeptide (TPR) repeat protein
MSLSDAERLAEARACLAGGDTRGAETHARAVLKSRPRDVEVLEILAALAFQDARLDDARMFLNRCVTLKPRDTSFRIRIAQLDVVEGRYGEAIARIQKAESINPRISISPGQKASIYRLNGDRAGARKVLESYRGKEDAEMACELAQLELDDGHLEEAIEIASRHLNDAGCPTDLLRSLHHVIGTAEERRGDHDRAFEAYRRAREPNPGLFDPDAWVRLSDRIMEAFSPGALAAMPRAANTSETPVFVVGMPRSGTTLVDRMIDAHPKGFGGGELPEITCMVRALPHTLATEAPWPECVRSLDAEQADELSRTYLKRLTRLARRAERVVNKNLDNQHYLGLIQVLFPAARVIRVHRDPLDTCLSCYASRLAAENHPYAFDLAHLGLAHREFDRLMEFWRETLDLRWHEVAYEDLVSNQEAETRWIVEFLDLPWDDACLRYYDSGRRAITLSRDQVSRPIYGSSVGRARRFEKHLAPLRETLGCAD